MKPNRVEAFSDGVIAIIVTIMVLELKTPHTADLEGLLHITPVMLSYILSFLVVAIMWVNHHHLLHLVKEVNGKLLWSNNLLLFWMSLIPFVTAYMGETAGAPLAVSMYGIVLGMSSFSFSIIRKVITAMNEQHEGITEVNRRINRKNAFSYSMYFLSAALAWVSVYLSYAVFVLIPVLYFLPEKAIEEHLEEQRRERIRKMKKLKGE